MDSLAIVDLHKQLVTATCTSIELFSMLFATNLKNREIRSATSRVYPDESTNLDTLSRF
jgi:hypothetical protein